MLKIILISAIVIYGFVYLVLAVKTKKPITTILIMGFCGMACLILINLTQKFTFICLPINLYTVGISGIFGLPGVVLLLVLNLIII